MKSLNEFGVNTASRVKDRVFLIGAGIVVLAFGFLVAHLRKRGYDLRLLAWVGAPMIAFLTIVGDYRVLWRQTSFWVAAAIGTVAGGAIAAMVMTEGGLPLIAAFVILAIAEGLAFDFVFRRMSRKR